MGNRFPSTTFLGPLLCSESQNAAVDVAQVWGIFWVVQTTLPTRHSKKKCEQSSKPVEHMMHLRRDSTNSLLILSNLLVGGIDNMHI